uniref:Uncharacterized protein n=1 Tax=Attheya septentrionalis TaxID=420275 RepID=A0A7S2XW82_9STRA|mmetsp:Transcript_7218/g.12954  ORF Transcript_7218/g.12954 Transcript_7218/m.12954 type:complete len:399 (+) Transcript_7218:103-1299(+)
MATTNDGQEEEEDNPYLRLRAAKIARNEARLKELGLIRYNHENDYQNTVARKKKRVAPRNPVTHQQPLRRSTRRAASIVTTGYIFPEPPPEPRVVARRQGTKRPRIKTASHVSLVDESSTMQHPNASDLPAVSSGSGPASVKTTSIHVPAVVLGPYLEELPLDDAAIDENVMNLEKDCKRCALGREVCRTGKAAVISHAVMATLHHDHVQMMSGKHDSDQSDKHNKEGWNNTELYHLAASNRLSFNKYCGVQEWRNNSLFLWVNIGGPDNSATNEFLNGGRQMTWFGGSRMHDESPVIQRLIKVGQQQQEQNNVAKNNEHNGGIVLWCRLYDSSSSPKGFRPYTCLGRVAYHSHQPGTRPIQFVWTLLDYDQLVQYSGQPKDKTDSPSMFQRIVDASL